MLLKRALSIRGFVFVDYSLGREAVEVALDVVEEFFGFFLIVQGAELFDLRSDATLLRLVALVPLFVLPHPLLRRFVSGHGLGGGSVIGEWKVEAYQRTESGSVDANLSSPG